MVYCHRTDRGWSILVVVLEKNIASKKMYQHTCTAIFLLIETFVDDVVVVVVTEKLCMLDS